jgi:hypothetical protein
VGSDNKQRAIELRQQGLSRSQIADALGLKPGGGALHRWLEGVPPPEWTKRANAKDDLRERAIELRRQGRSYREIREELHVSKSSLSLWLKDIELTDEQRERLVELQRISRTRAGRTMQARRIARREATVASARAQVAALAESELFVAGVVAYWAEGSKAKPWRPGEQVEFCNSDPTMIVLFLRWLELIGVTRDRLVCTLMIHETADVGVAHAFWAQTIGLPMTQFNKPLIKRHNPRTVRKNRGESYHGCLAVYVRCSTELSRQIEGWWQGIVASVA